MIPQACYGLNLSAPHASYNLTACVPRGRRCRGGGRREGRGKERHARSSSILVFLCRNIEMRPILKTTMYDLMNHLEIFIIHG